MSTRGGKKIHKKKKIIQKRMNTKEDKTEHREKQILEEKIKRENYKEESTNLKEEQKDSKLLRTSGI